MARKHIPMMKIADKQHRMVAFSKRRKGLFKKAQQFTTLSGSDVAIVVFSEAGRPYFHASSPHSFDFLVDQVPITTTTAPPAAASTASNSYVQDVEFNFRALLDFDVEAYDNVEQLVAFKRKLEQVRERLGWFIQYPPETWGAIN